MSVPSTDAAGLDPTTGVEPQAERANAATTAETASNINLGTNRLLVPNVRSRMTATGALLAILHLLLQVLDLHRESRLDGGGWRELLRLLQVGERLRISFHACFNHRPIRVVAVVLWLQLDCAREGCQCLLIFLVVS